MTPTRQLALLTLFSLVGLAGCQSLQTSWSPKWPQTWPWKKQDVVAQQEKQVPLRLVAIWSPDVLTQLGKRPARGFGGRLYFYNDANEAVEVEGQLVVYAYDDTDGDGTQQLPCRKFAFTAEQFANHRSDSPLGASYSVWLPWDGIDGYRRSISLVPIFTTKAGQVVMGQQAVNMLPGRIPANQAKEPTLASQPGAAGDSEVKHASHELAAARHPRIETDRAATSSGLERAIRTTTITVPSSMKRRLGEPSRGGPAGDGSATHTHGNRPFIHDGAASENDLLRSESGDPRTPFMQARPLSGVPRHGGRQPDGQASLDGPAVERQGGTFRSVPTSPLAAPSGYPTDENRGTSVMMPGQVPALNPPTPLAQVALQTSLNPPPSARSAPSQSPAPAGPDEQSAPTRDRSPRTRSGRPSYLPSEPLRHSPPPVPATWTNAARNAD